MCRRRDSAHREVDCLGWLDQRSKSLIPDSGRIARQKASRYLPPTRNRDNATFLRSRRIQQCRKRCLHAQGCRAPVPLHRERDGVDLLGLCTQSHSRQERVGGQSLPLHLLAQSISLPRYRTSRACLIRRMRRDCISDLLNTK